MLHNEWKLIYEKYSKALYLYALSLTGNPQDAEDLLQETFVKAFLSYEATGSIKSWLIIVLRNEFFNLMRKRKREMYENPSLSLENIAFCEFDLLDNIIQDEERKQLYLAIRKLPITMQEILIESVYLNMRDEEIAILHRTSQENVRQIRSRARKKIIEFMKEV
ncbi:MAG: RNA polymerase sigma factor [Agathobacter sp.]|nr:RNA polymerase sigma factor [Agathobacter sp.]